MFRQKMHAAEKRKEKGGGRGGRRHRALVMLKGERFRGRREKMTRRTGPQWERRGSWLRTQMPLGDVFGKLASKERGWKSRGAARLPGKQTKKKKVERPLTRHIFLPGRARGVKGGEEKGDIRWSVTLGGLTSEKKKRVKNGTFRRLLNITGSPGRARRN